MKWSNLLLALSACPLISLCNPLNLKGRPGNVIRAPEASDGLQDLVTWDEHSIFVRGERILFYSGEFHPFRLPVPSLWLDIFQKIKALGYSGVSFYTDWALLEGLPGVFSAEGIFALEPFFEAASEAGIYLLARPGAYINAEASGGGFPGWLQRLPGLLRSNDSGYLFETGIYIQSIAQIIAKAQITNGGPVILVQPENEYTYPYGNITFPNYDYFAAVEKQYRDAGIVVPFISNDAGPVGLFAPGNGTVSVDIYGHDRWIMLNNAGAQPYHWPDNSLPTYFHTLHLLESPTTPYSIVEFQGGSFDPWGGNGFAKCTTLLNEEFERVFYKNDFSFGVTIFNIYMTYGGTNWGNLGHPGGYTSYDYGAVIKEDRTVTREKFSEAKLLVNFLKVSPAYLTATPGSAGNGSLVNTKAIDVTPLYGNGSATNFYVVRHSAYDSLQTTQYKVHLGTSEGNITVPQMGGSLSLYGRDAKIHVTDYDIGGTTLLYSTGEIFTWQNYTSGTVLVLYGGAGEMHEFALPTSAGGYQVSSGSTVQQKTIGGAQVFQWTVTPSRQVVTSSTGNLTIYLLWRNDVYNWWALELPASSPVGNFTSPSKTKMIVSGGYLLRSASVQGSTISLVGDINATSTFEVVGGAPSPCTAVTFNNKNYAFKQGSGDTISLAVPYTAPQATVSSLASLQWHMIDSLPEISPSYDDSAWLVCNTKTSHNPLKLSTPFTLYASDYAFNTGSLLYRGYFNATGHTKPTLHLKTQGGYAYGYSIWLNSTFLGAFPGTSTSQNTTQSHPLPKLTAASTYVLTVLIDHMGLDENFNPGLDSMKNPRGILSYNLTSYPQSSITWKITGNLGGESYRDKTRGPLNEGGMYFERQGLHQPSPPLTSTMYNFTPTSLGASSANPAAGVTFYTAQLPLNLPTPPTGAYDIPLSFVFPNTTLSSSGSGPASLRAQLYVNGYQFGKYVNHIGPQTSYPVPEGILNYHGENWIGVSVWIMNDDAALAVGGFLGGMRIEMGMPVLTGRGPVELSPMPAWSAREGAY